MLLPKQSISLYVHVIRWQNSLPEWTAVRTVKYTGVFVSVVGITGRRQVTHTLYSGCINTSGSHASALRSADRRILSKIARTTARSLWISCMTMSCSEHGQCAASVGPLLAEIQHAVAQCSKSTLIWPVSQRQTQQVVT